MSHTSENSTGLKAFTATAAALAKGLRVKVDSAGKILVSEAANDAIGVTAEPIAASGTGNVKLFSAPGTYQMVAAGPVTRGAVIYPATAGRVDDVSVAAGTLQMVALEAAGADGDLIECAFTNELPDLDLSSGLSEGTDIVLGTTTGSKIGTAAAQKLGFWNATPVIQQASADQTAVTDSTGGSVADAIAAAVTAPTAITDSTTGATTATFAAGVGVYDMSFSVSLINTGAVDVVTGVVIGHKFKILSWEFVTSGVKGVGSGASRVYNMEIGTTDVGSVASTLTLTEASTSDFGERTAGTAVSGANTGTASDAFSIEIATGGTDFSAGSGTIVVKIQNMDTADAIAGICTAQTANRLAIIALTNGLAKTIELANALRAADVATGIIKGSA